MRQFDGPGIIVGTGPSLSKALPLLRRCSLPIFGVNNTYRDLPLACWIACDPKWHQEYSPVEIEGCDQWHWSAEICAIYGYRYIEGRWGNGLSTDRSYIHYGHSSSYQALGLARHYGCDPCLLVGFDMQYRPGVPRHYFGDLSADRGEYPAGLRKWSAFDGLHEQYQTIADQKDRPTIINCTPGSALTCFPVVRLEAYL